MGQERRAVHQYRVWFACQQEARGGWHTCSGQGQGIAGPCSPATPDPANCVPPHLQRVGAHQRPPEPTHAHLLVEGQEGGQGDAKQPVCSGGWGVGC